MRNFVRSFAVFWLAVFGPALLPICCNAFAQETQVVDGIAAVVNGDVITYSQVRALSAPREKLLRQQVTGEELNKKLIELREMALKDLIDRRLVIQAFKKESYQIPDHVVDERMHQIIRESFGGDRNTFIKTLAAQNSIAQHRSIPRTAPAIMAATGAGSSAILWLPRSKSSRSTCRSVESATSSITQAIITFSKSKINTAAPLNRSPKCGRTLRRDYSKRKPTAYRNAGSPACAQRLTSRPSERISLFFIRLVLILLDEKVPSILVRPMK